MTEEKKVNEAEIGYGYADDAPRQGTNLHFGLNAGKTFLKEFKWIPNAGKDGAAQEALNVTFDIDGTEKSYRIFPVSYGFKKGTQEKVYDIKAPEFKEAVVDNNAKIVHIVAAFVDRAAVKAALSKPFKSFKEYCETCRNLLPGKNTPTIALDIFLGYQWAFSAGKDRTYLEIPKSTKYGNFLCKAVAGEWKATKLENPEDNVQEALFYTNEKGEKHPFTRTGWFMNNNFAKQQRQNGSSDTTDDTTEGTTTESEAVEENIVDDADTTSGW